MYYEIMEEQESGVLPEILQRLLERDGISAAELARRIGIHKSTLSLILSGKQATTSVVVAAKMAQVFDVSVDYLLGLSTSPEPTQSSLTELLVELTRVAKKLSSRRQHDLLLVAQAYLEDSERAKADPDRLMDDLLSLIKEYDGEVSRDELLNFLDREVETPDAGETLLLLGDDDE
jgi:transcriptional regulator with XRE-family HTH domain